MDAHTTSIAFAYGLLWHVVTPDPRVNRARRMLMERLTHSQRGLGIQLAKDAGCLITMREMAVVDAVIDTKPEPNHQAPLRALRIAAALRKPRPIKFGLAR